MTTYTVNVGANTNPKYLGLSGPIYPNGTFDFIPIPLGIRTGTTYREIGLESAFRRMGIEDRLDEIAHHCPEFTTFTYGTYPTLKEGRNVARLQDAREEDWLFFVASLQRTNHEQMGPVFQEWIAENRGMYFIGMFEIEGILTPYSFDTEKKLRPYRNSEHFGWLKNIEGDQSWIFKGSRFSLLFPIAIPIRRKDVEALFGVKRKATQQTETAYVNSHTRSAREVKDVNYLRNMVARYNPRVRFP